MRVDDYDLYNLMLRIEKDRDRAIELSALQDLLDCKFAITEQNKRMAVMEEQLRKLREALSDIRQYAGVQPIDGLHLFSRTIFFRASGALDQDGEIDLPDAHTGALQLDRALRRAAALLTRYQDRNLTGQLRACNNAAHNEVAWEAERFLKAGFFLEKRP